MPSPLDLFPPPRAVKNCQHTTPLASSALRPKSRLSKANRSSRQRPSCRRCQVLPAYVPVSEPQLGGRAAGHEADHGSVDGSFGVGGEAFAVAGAAAIAGSATACSPGPTPTPGISPGPPATPLPSSLSPSNYGSGAGSPAVPVWLIAPCSRDGLGVLPLAAGA